jgi:capsular exopolysaccharide synthesis family protein
MTQRVREHLPDSITGYSVSAEAVKDADLLRINASASRPEVAIAVVNAYATTYQDYNLEMNRSDATSVRDFIENQLKIVGDRLDTSERNLEAYKKDNKFVDLTSDIGAKVAQASNAEAKLAEIGTDEQAKQATLAHLQDLIDQQQSGMSAKLEGISSPLVTNLKGNLNELEIEKTNLLIQGYTEQSPRIQNLDKQITDVRQQLSTESQHLIEQQGFLDPVGQLSDLVNQVYGVQTDLVTLRAEEASYKSALANYEVMLQGLPETERQMAHLTRDVETDQTIYTLLSQRYEEARIQEVSRVSSIRIVDLAQGAGRIKPNVQSNILFGFFLALGLAIGCAFVVDYTDTSIRSPEGLERQGLSVLANVPLLARDRRAKAAGITSHLLTHTSPESSGAEAFRMLRTSIQFASIDKPIRSIMVTSSGPLEGKSTVAVNLATVLAQAGFRTLLIDADLRRPMLHRVFDQKRKPGFTDLILSGGSSTEGVVFSTPVDRLFCLPSGFTPPSPADVLSSSAAENLLQKLQQQYDYIVLDSPPSLIAADAAILAGKADATILVVRAGRTSLEAIQQTEKLVRQAGGRFLGAVLNCVRYTRRRGYYYYYHYYRYRYTHQPTTPARTTETTAGPSSPGPNQPA